MWEFVHHRDCRSDIHRNSLIVNFYTPARIWCHIFLMARPKSVIQVERENHFFSFRCFATLRNVLFISSIPTAEDESSAFAGFPPSLSWAAVGTAVFVSPLGMDYDRIPLRLRRVPANNPPDRDQHVRDDISRAHEGNTQDCLLKRQKTFN